MRITIPNEDVIKISSIKEIEDIDISKRYHLIKLDFYPEKLKFKKILEIFSRTNRFIIDKHIKEFNVLFREVSKKYYVENKEEDMIFTFLRRNNKVLLNFLRMKESVKDVLLSKFLEDILNNTEVILLNEKDYQDNEKVLNQWKGNVILSNSLL